MASSPNIHSTKHNYHSQALVLSKNTHSCFSLFHSRRSKSTRRQCQPCNSWFRIIEKIKTIVNLLLCHNKFRPVDSTLIQSRNTTQLWAKASSLKTRYPLSNSEPPDSLLISNDSKTKLPCQYYYQYLPQFHPYQKAWSTITVPFDIFLYHIPNYRFWGIPSGLKNPISNSPGAETMVSPSLIVWVATMVSVAEEMIKIENKHKQHNIKVLPSNLPLILC